MDEFVDRPYFGPQGLASRKGKKLAGELGAARGALLGRGDNAPEAFIAGDRARKQVEIAHDDEKQIVEVMGHAPGELAHRLHFLGMPQRILGRAPLRHLGRNPLLQALVQKSNLLIGKPPVKGHAQQVGDPLQEVGVVLGEGARLLAVGLEHAVGPAFTE